MKVQALLDLKKNKYFLISLIAIFVFFLSPIYSNYSKKYIDNSLKQAAISYALTRSINAAVSVIKNSSLSIGVGIEGNIAIGEVLDPINDATERFSDLLTISLWTLGAEKILFEISNLKGFLFFVILLSILNVLIRSFFLNKFLILLIFLKLFIPTSSFISSYLDKYYFNPQIAKINNTLKPYVKNINVNTNEGFWNRFKDNKISKIIKYTKFYLQNTSIIINSIIQLGALYIGKLLLNILLLPLIFVFIIKNFKLE